MSEDLIKTLVQHAEIAALLGFMAWLNHKGRIADQIMAGSLLAALGGLGLKVTGVV